MFSFAEMKQEQIRFGEKYQLVQLNNQSQVWKLVDAISKAILGALGGALLNLCIRDKKIVYF